MKIMNELEAEFDMEILEVLVEDGQPVEFDTPLFRVKRV
jgi:acetyl-CoA carboxylase biotin carboxyl carrier protein